MNKSGRGGFKPGQSGNPGGRPKRHIGDLSRETRRYAQLALGVLVKICRSGLERNRLAAARELLDRGFGRPIQQIDASEVGTDQRAASRRCPRGRACKRR